MHRKHGALCEGQHLDSVVVGTNEGNVLLRQPQTRLVVDARLCIEVDIADVLLSGQPTGVQQYRVAGLDLKLRSGKAGFKVSPRDHFSTVQGAAPQADHV